MDSSLKLTEPVCKPVSCDTILVSLKQCNQIYADGKLVKEQLRKEERK
jgi:hypothetical protein